MNACSTVTRLLEDEAAPAETTTLRAIFFNEDNDEPEQHVLDMFSRADLDRPLPVEERDPGSLLSTQGRPIRQCVSQARQGVHGEHIAHYRVNPGQPVVVDGIQLLDGNHRALAAYLSKRKVRVVDVTRLD